MAWRAQAMARSSRSNNDGFPFKRDFLVECYTASAASSSADAVTAFAPSLAVWCSLQSSCENKEEEVNVERGNPVELVLASSSLPIMRCGKFAYNSSYLLLLL